MDINAKDVFLGMKHAMAAMREGGGGSIVNISSISGFVGQPFNHMGYNASKGAVRIMTKSATVQAWGERSLPAQHRGLVVRQQTASSLRLLSEQVMPQFK